MRIDNDMSNPPLEDELVGLVGHDLHKLNLSEGLRENHEGNLIFPRHAPEVARRHQSRFVIPVRVG